MIFSGKHIASCSTLCSILNEWCYKHTPIWNSSKLWGILAKHCIFFCECCRNVWTPYLRTCFFLLISLMFWFFSVLIFFKFAALIFYVFLFWSQIWVLTWCSHACQLFLLFWFYELSYSEFLSFPFLFWSLICVLTWWSAVMPAMLIRSTSMSTLTFGKSHHITSWSLTHQALLLKVSYIKHSLSFRKSHQVLLYQRFSPSSPSKSFLKLSFSFLKSDTSSTPYHSQGITVNIKSSFSI